MAEMDLGRATGEIVINTDGAKRSVDGLTSSLNSSISKAGQTMARTGQRLSFGVTLPLVAIGTKAVQTSIEFTKTMNTMAAVAGVPGPELEKLRQLSIKLGQDTVFSANEAGEAMLELGKAGVSTADIMGGALKNTLDLATAGDLNLADSATIVANAMHTFGLKGTEAKEIADAFAGAANASSADVTDLAQALTQGGNAASLAGASIQEATAFLGALADQGIRGSDAGTSLKTFMLSLVPTSTTAKEAIKKLNLEFVNSDGSIRSLSEVSDELHDKLGGLTQAQQQTALKTIFGTDAFRAAATAMKLGSDGLADYEDATNKVGAASDVAAGKLKGLPGIIETLKGSIDTALLTLGDTLQPIVSGVANAITDLLNLFIALPQPIKTAIVVVAGLAAAAGPLLFVFGHAATLFSVLLGPIGLLIAAIAAAVGAFIALNGGIKGTIKVVGDFFSNLGRALAPAVASFKAMVVGIGAALAPLGGLFSSIGDDAKKKVGGAFTGITDAINTFAAFLADVVPQAVSAVVNFILRLIDIWNGLSPTVQTAIKFVGLFIAAIVPVIHIIGVVVGVIGTLLSAWAAVSAAIAIIASPITLVVLAIAALVAAFILFHDQIVSVASTIINALQPVIDFIGGAFVDIWHALVDVWNEDLKPALADLGGLFGDLKSIFIDLLPLLKVLGVAAGILLVGPFLILIKVLPAAIKILGFFIKIIVQVIRTVVAAAKLLIQLFANIAGAIIRFVIASVRQLGIFIGFVARIPGDVAHFFTQMYNAVVTWVGKAVNWIVDKWNGIVRFFGSLGGKLANAGRHMWDWIVDGAKGVANAAIGIINSIIDRINQFQIHINQDNPGPVPDIHFDWNGPQIPHIPGFATGIKDFLGGLAIVGERGPEIVSLPRGSDVLPNRILRSLERGTSIRQSHGASVITPQPSMRGVSVVGTVDTPFGPAELRGIIRDEIEDNDNFRNSLVRMGRRFDDDD